VNEINFLISRQPQQRFAVPRQRADSDVPDESDRSGAKCFGSDDAQFRRNQFHQFKLRFLFVVIPVRRDDDGFPAEFAQMQAPQP
jgi:hypothetical protein